MAQETPLPRDWPVLTGVFQVPERMEKRTCALCPKDLECGVIYIAPSKNIVAHENCLLYSSKLVEFEVQGASNKERNFDVESVKKEIHRGRRLRCSGCKQGGATVGCENRTCTKSYHYFCAEKDNAILQDDKLRGTYKLFCKKHAENAQEPAENTQSDATVKVPPLKKFKEAGLLNELFEGILDKLDLIQGRLMDEKTSESEYEEIEALLFGCGLFKDTLKEFQKVIKSKVREYEERQKQLTQQLEALEDLKKTLCSFH